MLMFEVHIGDTSHVSAGPLRPDEPTPEIRSVYWRGEAASDEAARLAGWQAWDKKYGAGRQPVAAIVEVTVAAA